MFADMDFNLRELGVGDLSISKRVRAMWEAFHGRAMAYDTALDANDETALADALGRNVWRGAAPAGAPQLLARAALRQLRHLDTIGLATLRTGAIEFLPAAAALA
jgi:cytochrome b pre-mRNA-processing protein 3